MNRDETKALFDEQAAKYDNQWTKMAPIRGCLYLLLDPLFADLPGKARMLCVGVGTGDELVNLALKNPDWHFTAVEPSGPMLDLCRKRAVNEGVASRCTFHEGYLDALPTPELHDAATCFMVSQFVLDESERVRFFRDIAERLKPGALLASADLASDRGSPEYDVLLQAWMTMLTAADLSAEAMERMRKAYANDVGILPPPRVASIIASAGFELPVQFFQAGLIHAWRSRRVG